MNIIIKLFKFFDSDTKKNLIILSLLILLTSFLQLLGLSSMIPAIAILSDEALIFNNKILNFIYYYLGFSEINNFKIFVIIVSCALIFLTVLINYITIYLQNKFVGTLHLKLETRFFKDYLNTNYNFFKKKRSSEILLMINTFLPQFKDNVVGNLLNIYSQTIILSYILLALLIWNIQITFLLIIILGFFYISFYFLIKKRLKNTGDQLVQILLEKNKYAYDSVNNFKFLQFIKNTEFYIDNFKHKSYNAFRLALTNTKLMSLPKNFLEIILFCGSMILALFIFLSNDGETQHSFITLSVFAIATIKALPACNQIFHNFYNFKLYLPVFERILNEKNDLTNNIKNLQKSNMNLKYEKNIKLKNINFKHHDSSFSLRDISLKIDRNTIVGIMGKSGSGKTTLIDVLSGLYKINSGDFLVDNNRLNSDEISLLRKKFSYVPQDIFLVDASIKQNIAIANKDEEIDINRVIEASKKAEIYEYIISLDKKFDTLVGEQGYKLSGGQKQRLGIARALYQKPEIMIFDESTSALDYVTEKLFLKTMEKLKKELTCIFVSHKIETMKFCDKIIYIHDGKINFSGKYKEIKDRYFSSY